MSTAWDELPESARSLFGIALGDREVRGFEAFVDLLERWSARINLVGAASRDEIINRHLLDSLAPARFLGAAHAIVDYGSGAGFPAIPLAVLLPNLRFYLVESRRKRCSFLRQVSRTIQLENVTIWEGRGEIWEPPPGGVDTATGRALALEQLAALAKRVLPDGGCLISMRKENAGQALDGFEEIGSHRYQLPGGQRHEVAAYRRV